MTTHNAGEFLEAQLRSIIGQTKLPDEVVIVDDASEDETWAALRRFARIAPVAVNLRRQARRVGLGTNIQSALSLCAGDVIALSDQDDVWYPMKVETCLAAFADPQVTVWFSDADLIDDRGAEVDESAWTRLGFDEAERAAMERGEALMRLVWGCTVTGATMAVRSRVVRAAVPFPAGVGEMGDFFLHDGWLSLIGASIGAVAAEAVPQIAYRQHDRQLTRLTSLAEGREQMRISRRERHAQLASDYARVRLACDQLRRIDDANDLDGGVLSRRDVRRLVRFEEFLALRATPRGARWRRVPAAVLRGEYSTYARGLRTAVLDLLVS